MFPAPAGINRSPGVFFSRSVSVPRASGDKPGWHQISKEYDNVFPAPAGINRPRTSTQQQAHSVPRASGDKPLVQDA
ncbi:hypothetical protein [Escherichia coli]|uniref:hypothetical protein n=1 Tax=Escherichia coli TaxID=562 RepID=UPI0039656D25